MVDHDVFCKLPLDVIFQILTKLPTKSLLELRRVCKYFNPLILHPHFLKLHIAVAADRRHVVYYESTDYAKSYFTFRAGKTLSECKILEHPVKSVHGFLRTVGSDRGVLCLYDTNYFSRVGTVILWNPFIGRYKTIRWPRELYGFRTGIIITHAAVGFGFDPINFDFKVVKILYGCDNECEVLPKAMIYGVKSGWRISELVVPCFMPSTWSSNVFVNGVVHWLAFKQRGGSNSPPNCIMGFNVVEEVFYAIDLPQNLGPDLKELRLCSWVDEKTVALFCIHGENVGNAWDLWVMNEYGKVESWTKKRTIVLLQPFFPLKFVNGGDVLAVIGDEKLVSLDLEKEKAEDLQVCGLGLSFYAASFVPSLAMIEYGDRR